MEITDDQLIALDEYLNGISDYKLIVWDVYNSQQTWDWYPLKDWPRKYQNIWLSERHPRFEQRKSMLAFFMNDGMSPYLAVEAMLKRWPNQFDDSAVRHMNAFVKWKEGVTTPAVRGPIDEWDVMNL